MNAPDLFALHEAIKHWAYAQAQAHPLNSDAWLQVAYWIEALCWMTPGVFVGWWCRAFMRSASPRLHEHKGRVFEQHHTGKWLQHLHDEETGELASLKVFEGMPPGTEPPARIELTSPRQRFKSAR